MKKLTTYLILLFLISSCSHRIVRTGYQTIKSDYKNCEIIIKKFMTVNDSVQKVGEIKLGDTGFSVSCSEAQALEILKNEGCAVNANIINITKEIRPDLLSTCYRCEAEFYIYRYPTILNQNTEYYQSDEINKRVSKDRTRNIFVGIGAAALGFIIGTLLFY